jgi:hypothetical protein
MSLTPNYDKTPSFADLQGMTLVRAERLEFSGDDVVYFESKDGRAFALQHHQDCCESVNIVDLTGDLADLVGTPILLAEMATSETNPDDVKDGSVYTDESMLWTFYKLRTVKGSVDIRWYGSSNGYYGVEVSFDAVERRAPEGTRDLDVDVPVAEPRPRRVMKSDAAPSETRSVDVDSWDEM